MVLMDERTCLGCVLSCCPVGVLEGEQFISVHSVPFPSGSFVGFSPWVHPNPALPRCSVTVRSLTCSDNTRLPKVTDQEMLHSPGFGVWFLSTGRTSTWARIVPKKTLRTELILGYGMGAP